LPWEVSDDTATAVVVVSIGAIFLGASAGLKRPCRDFRNKNAQKEELGYLCHIGVDALIDDLSSSKSEAADIITVDVSHLSDGGIFGVFNNCFASSKGSV
jgi:hypothetical protein